MAYFYVEFRDLWIDEDGKRQTKADKGKLEMKSFDVVGFKIIEESTREDAYKFVQEHYCTSFKPFSRGYWAETDKIQAYSELEDIENGIVHSFLIYEIDNNEYKFFIRQFPNAEYGIFPPEKKSIIHNNNYVYCILSSKIKTKPFSGDDEYRYLYKLTHSAYKKELARNNVWFDDEELGFKCSGYCYENNVINDSLLEEYISKSERGSYFYAIEVLRERFKLGEKVIKKDSELLKEKYENYFGIKL